MKMGINTATGQVSVESEYSLADIKSMQRFLSALERSMKMKMTAENLNFWLVTASEMNRLDVFEGLAETLTTSPASSQERGIEMWIQSVSNALDGEADTEAQRLAEIEEKAKVLREMYNDE
jgi:hypothetical protein